MTATLELTEIVTAGGHVARFACRPDTNDGALVHGIIGESEYPLAELQGLSGEAIDIGAHIGIVSVALALDNPNLHIIAVEPIPENFEMLGENVAQNGLRQRVAIIEAAASSGRPYRVPITYGWDHYDGQPDGYMRDSRYIGGMVGANESSITIFCASVGLFDIVPADKEIVLLKIDCEGCEYEVLTSDRIPNIKRIIGEFHRGAEGIHFLLDATHNVTITVDRGGVGMFNAVRR